MLRNIIATWTIVALAGLGAEAQAASTSKEEAIGVGTGAVVGAAAGGPVGLIIGAAIGAKLGDNYHKKNEQLSDLESSLGGSENRVTRLESDIETLSSEIERMQTEARPELVSLMQAGVDTDLLFRTDEYALTRTTADRLERMAEMLAGMPEIRIQLDGFADERGAAEYNQALSEKRVEFVRSLFVAAGVHPTRIQTSAHGESTATDSTVDSYALERRVSVKLYIDDLPSVAASN